MGMGVGRKEVVIDVFTGGGHTPFNRPSPNSGNDLISFRCLIVYIYMTLIFKLWVATHWAMNSNY